MKCATSDNMPPQKELHAIYSFYLLKKESAVSLIKKILTAFFVMAALAVVAAVIGWRAVGGINDAMVSIVEYEVPANERMSGVDVLFQSATVAQRTLLNPTIALETRAEQRQTLAKRLEELTAAEADLTALLDRGAGHVAGWDALRVQWNEFLPRLQAWRQATLGSLDQIARWEETTILNPDALLKNIMQYRGDHFALAARLAEAILNQKDSGPDINPADNVCAFGRWRERFDNGLEVFSANKTLSEAMEIMTEPHREFHKSAADVQQLIRDGFEKNREAIEARFAEHLAAAQKVVSTFSMITGEADKAQQLYSDAGAFAMLELLHLRNEASTNLEALIAANAANMQANSLVAARSGEENSRAMQTLALIALGLGVLANLYLYLTMRSQLTKPLTRVISALSSDAEMVSTEAGSVEGSSAALSDGSNKQASALEQTSAAIEEITAMAQRNLENAHNANDDMKKNAEQINESTGAIERMSSAMGEIKDSSEKIGNILKTIEDIAFQTNLLALNAAVEAARAGEAGKGFAVVADEVRNLAQRSAQAVKDTAELITGTVDRVNNGVGITGEIERHFGEIAGTTGKITRMIGEIDVATTEQTQGLEQINQAVSQIDQVNQENSHHAESNATASVNLSRRSENLMEQIDDLAGVLKTIIGARGVPAARGAVQVQSKAGGKSGGKGVKSRMSAAKIAAPKRVKALPAPVEEEEF